MKKLFGMMCLLVAVVFMAMPNTVASANENPMGVYVAPKIGLTSLKTLRLGGAAYEEDVNWGFAVGYNLMPQQDIPVRVEVEAMRLYDDKTKKHSRGWESDLEISTLFVNAYYDIYTGTRFTPYVGLGIGMAYVDADLKHFDKASRALTGKDSRTSKDFAWNVGGGVSYNFTQNFALDAQYKFIKIHSVPDYGSMNAHSLMLGFRVTF